jgi:hypothetical protein
MLSCGVSTVRHQVYCDVAMCGRSQDKGKWNACILRLFTTNDNILKLNSAVA